MQVDALFVRYSMRNNKLGVPVMRAMMLEFTADPNSGSFGSSIYVRRSLPVTALIFNDRGIASYYLPEGIWTHFLTGEKIAGGRWIFNEQYDYFSVPLLARSGSIIAIGSVDTPARFRLRQRTVWNFVCV